LGGVWNDGIPAEVAAIARDPAILDQLADVFRRNSRSADGLQRHIPPEEARRLAAQALDALLDPDGLQMADVGGMRFYLQLDTELYPGPNLLLANAWDGIQWRPVAEVRLPGGRDPEV
jgi:hypothetical protein